MSFSSRRLMKLQGAPRPFKLQYATKSTCPCHAPPFLRSAMPNQWHGAIAHENACGMGMEWDGVGGEGRGMGWDAHRMARPKTMQKTALKALFHVIGGHSRTTCTASYA